MFEAALLLSMLGVVVRVIMARGKTRKPSRPALISLSPELKPARKISGKHLA